MPDGRVAICPGSYDPVTNGHLDIIDRASRVFERVIVGVVNQPVRKAGTLFTAAERRARRAARERLDAERAGARVEVEHVQPLDRPEQVEERLAHAVRRRPRRGSAWRGDPPSLVRAGDYAHAQSATGRPEGRPSRRPATGRPSSP